MRASRLTKSVFLLTTLLGLSSLGFAQAATFTARPNPVVPGQTVTFIGNPTIPVTASNIKVTLWFYNSGGGYVGSATQTGLNFTAGQPTAVSIAYATLSSMGTGTYTYNLSYYNSDGTHLSGATGQTGDGNFIVGTQTLHTDCATPTVVGLKWASVNTATSYTVTRGGTTLGSTGLLTYTDQTVAPATSYAYAVKAYNGTTLLSTQSLTVKTSGAIATGEPAYCLSPLIKGMTWNWSTGTDQQDGSDLWSNTWGTDGNIYLFFGDGGGFYGTDSAGRASFGIGKITGSTPGISPSTASNVFGGYQTAHASTINGKTNSIIAIGSNFYALGGIWQAGEGGPSGGPNHYELIHSTGNAYSWVSNYSNWIFCSNQTSPTGFCPTSFVNFGAGNAGAIDSYVYLLGVTEDNFIGDGTLGLCACTYLARVLNDNTNMLTKASYQVYTGVNAAGVPQWSSTWANMQPIFVDKASRPMHINKMVYNSALQRFISVGQGGAVNRAAFYESPKPWGPFTAIGYYNANSDNTGGWGNLGTTTFGGGHGDSLGINFMNKWTSANGLTMWATFSSNGAASADAYLPSLAGQSMDSFNLVSATLTLR
jgi:hypothetical protein